MYRDRFVFCTFAGVLDDTFVVVLDATAFSASRAAAVAAVHF
jgi:hypothetical protein